VGEVMEWKDIAQLVYYVAGIIGVLGTLLAACLALSLYRRNSELERARWASSLYEKFYEKKGLKTVRDKLDCIEADSDAVRKLVSDAESDFTDYLNFFEFIAFLKKSKQLNAAQIEDLFGFYLGCLEKHSVVVRYVLELENGYEGVASLLNSRKESRQIR
jgi:hypothetical protein